MEEVRVWVALWIFCALFPAQLDGPLCDNEGYAV